jgi:hypothetical protein
MATQIGGTTAQLAGVLGAFARRVKNRYGSHSPFMVDRSGKSRKYRMDERVARTLREAKERLSD